MELLRGAIRQYAWGSHTALAELTGRPVPSPHPEAELWLGAHPGDPARLITAEGERSLLDVLRDDGPDQLGRTVASRFGSELPFLMKVIAADQPLSLQAHPDAAQAVSGFEREDATGIAVTAPHRNYRDRRHKPEIVVALEPFEALAGFRPLADTRRLLQAFGIDSLVWRARLNMEPASNGLRALLRSWMTLPAELLSTTVSAAMRGAERYLTSGGVLFVPEAKTLLELGARYPEDAGVLVALLLNRITLQPGEALFLPAGNLHAYLRGVAVEVMANSDNVLRGGLTSKHVDVAELEHILDFTPVEVSSLQPAPLRDGARIRYSPPVDEFCVSVWKLDGAQLDRDVPAIPAGGGPHILLCTQGSLTIDSADCSVPLKRGEAAWIPDRDRAISLRAHENAVVFAAGVPDARLRHAG